MQQAGNWKPENSKAIIANVESVFKNNDITKLNKSTYQFVANLGGFIAHYDLYGFQGHYEDLRAFADNLLNACTKSTADREANDSDFNKWYGHAYCQSKADAINGIREVVLKYQNKTSTVCEDKDMQKLNKIIELATEIKRRNDPELRRKFLESLE